MTQQNFGPDSEAADLMKSNPDMIVQHYTRRAVFQRRVQIGGILLSNLQVQMGRLSRTLPTVPRKLDLNYVR